LLIDKEPLDLVEDGNGPVGTGGRGRKQREDVGLPQAVAAHVNVEGSPQPYGAIRAHEGHGILVTETKLLEQAVKITQTHAARDDPAKRSVCVGDASAEADQKLPIVADPGPADEKSRISPAF